MWGHCQQAYAWLYRVSLAQQTREGAAKALAALRYEERCEVQQLSEPASAISLMAQGPVDGVPMPDPGVAVLIVRSSCPSNTSLSVQVLNRHMDVQGMHRYFLSILIRPSTGCAGRHHSCRKGHSQHHLDGDVWELTCDQ